MTTATDTAYHATEAEFVAALIEAQKNGLRLEAAIMTSGATHQPVVIAWRPKHATQTLHRFNAMADGTHHTRRLAANCKAYAMIAAAKEAAK